MSDVDEVMGTAAEIKAEVQDEAKRLYDRQRKAGESSWEDLHPYMRELWVGRAEGEMVVDGRLSFHGWDC